MSAAVAYLRRRTVLRAFHAYRAWVGKAVGWWTVVYLVGWLAIFVMAGLEALAPLAAPLAFPRTLVAAAIAAWFLGLAFAGRVPPVILDRRDLHRLALAPVAPWSAIRFRFLLRAVGWAAAGALLGLAATALAPVLFHAPAPWAAPVFGLVSVARFTGAWSRYARSTPGAGPAGWAVAVLGAGAAFAPYGFADALVSPSALLLLPPALLAVVGLLTARRSLASEWPPRFAAQSLVLTQLQAMRILQLMAGAAGFVKQAAADGAERRRLLAALHDTPGATRPRRSLPLPLAGSAPWRALAWRTATDLWRRPPLRSAGALLTTFIAAAATLLVNGGAGALPGPAGGPGPAQFGATTLFGGALAVLVAAGLVAGAGSTLLGPEFAIGVRPIEPTERTLGRVAPGALLFLAFGLPCAWYLGLGPGSVLGAASLVTIVLLALEKYGSWSGAGSGRWESQTVAAILAALPSLVLSALGAPGWVVPAQVGLALMLLLVAV